MTSREQRAKFLLIVTASTILTTSSSDIVGEVVGNSGIGVVTFNKDVADALFSIDAAVDVVNRCADVTNVDDTGADDDKDNDGNNGDVRVTDECTGRNDSDSDVAARDEDGNGNDVTDAEPNGDNTAEGDNAIDDHVVAVTVPLGSIPAAVSIVNAFDKMFDGEDDDHDDDDLHNISGAGAHDGNNDDGDSVDRATLRLYIASSKHYGVRGGRGSYTNSSRSRGLA